MKKLVVLLGLSLIIFASCTPQKPKKEGLEIIWEQGKLPFWQFLKGLSLTYDEKVGVRQMGFNAYGKVTLVNHHSQPIQFESLKEIMRAHPTQYLPDGSILVSTHPYPSIRWTKQRLVPEDTLHLYLIFEAEMRIARDSKRTWRPDSIDHSFHYKLVRGNVNKQDSSIMLNLILKREAIEHYKMIVKTREDKQCETEKTKTRKPKLSSNPLKKDFTDFLEKFPVIHLNKTYDLPQITKRNAPPDSSQIINSIYMRRFVRRAIRLYSVDEDTVTNFVKEGTLLRLSGLYVGRLNYSSGDQNQMTTVLVKLFDPDNYYTTKIHAYQLLCFFDTNTGEALGYDLVTGHKNAKYFQDFQSRLHLINHQLVVEKTASGEDFLCRGQKYRVNVGKYLGYKRLKKSSIEALTLPLKEAKKTIQGVDYQTYCNSQIGYCVDVPFKVFTYATYTGEEIPSEHFVSKDQQSLLMIKKKRFYYEDSLGRPDYQAYFKYHGYSKSPSDTINRLIKSRLYKDYCEFVVFRNNGLAFREVHFFRKKHIIRVLLWYPQRQRPRYEKIARQIIKSFK
ncbi:MAG TPA: hypothetical protein DCS93_29540 [Microscillaceae bacterium]|nr:hypothetical protein [Microscillaceae bacterium]